MKKIIYTLIVLIAFTGCNSISSLKVYSKKNLSDLARYSTVIVLDIEEKFDEKISQELLQEYGEGSKPVVVDQAMKSEAKEIGKYLADEIADEIRQRKIFKRVLRTPSASDALVVHGYITKYFFPGCFECEIILKDNKSNIPLGCLRLKDNNPLIVFSPLAPPDIQSYKFLQKAIKKISREIIRTQRAYK